MKRILVLSVALFHLYSCELDNVSIVTIGFGSCNEPSQNQTPILSTLSEALDTLDAYLWLGDNIYLKEEHWQHKSSIAARYAEVFGTPEFQEVLGKSTHYAIWDDHDAGPNDCDASFKGMPQAMQAFKDFWKPSYPMPDTTSYYGSVSLTPEVDLFLLDNRSFRTSYDSESPTVLGSAQQRWFEQAYMASKADFKVVLLGGQLLNSAVVFENMSRYPEERQWLMDVLASNDGIPIVLTGDRHSGEINRWRDVDEKVILEATASPLTATAHPHHEEANKYRIHQGTTDTQHFGILRLVKDERNGVLEIDIYLINPEGNVLIAHRETFKPK